MKHTTTIPSPMIDLGRASRETKGTAIFDIDVSSGQLRYVPGAVTR